MKMIFFALWGLSLLLMLAAAAQLWRAFVRKKEEVTRALAKSLGLLFVSIFRFPGLIPVFCYIGSFNVTITISESE